MMKRFTINALATVILAAGGVALSGASPAEASSFDGCDNYRAARMEHMTDCMNSGGTSFSSSGWCSSTGYYLESNCTYAN
jgi:hypothetical protein